MGQYQGSLKQSISSPRPLVSFPTFLSVHLSFAPLHNTFHILSAVFRQKLVSKYVEMFDQIMNIHMYFQHICIFSHIC